MTYTIKTRRKVSAKEFAGTLTKQILDRMERFEDMIPDDLEEIESPLSEISEYLENIQDQIALSKKDNKPEYEKTTGHEMGVASGRV